MLPVGRRWGHREGIALIGDAAHLATPFAGEGVNLALQDSERPAKAILQASSADDLDHRVGIFEADMFARAKSMRKTTLKMLTLMFHEANAPRSPVEQYVGEAVGYGMSTWLRPLMQTIVNVYSFVLKLLW